MTANDSGVYRITGGILSYRSEVYGTWELPISEITIIGEYTNEDGPFADDYFIAFLTDAEPGWLEASFYGEGRDSMLEELSRVLGSDLSCGLAHSTTFTSRILWPEHKKSRELFELLPEGRFRNRQRIKPDVKNQINSEHSRGRHH
jgi:hypothetical protein